MVKRFYIDYENVHAAGLDGLEQLDADDVVNVIYTRNADSMPFSMHTRICEAPCEVRLLEAECGTPSALDFQLSSLLGHDIHAHPGDSFRVVSRDTGYRCLSRFWATRDADVHLVSNLAEDDVITLNERVSDLTEALRLTDEDKKFVASTVTRLKTKQGINQAFQKRFGNERTSKVYAAVKPLLADKKAK